MKTALLYTVVLGIVMVAVVAVAWLALDAAGVLDSLRQTVTEFTSSDTRAGLDINQYIQLPKVLGFTALLAALEIVLITAFATIVAFLYNMSADIVGGLEVTLSEDS